MRKIIIQKFITLDGLIQAPGRPEEDKSSDFKYGGRTAPYFYEADEAEVEFMQKNMNSTDLLLEKKTYETFAAYWPDHADIWPGINNVTKYVVSNSLTELAWKNTKLISGYVVACIKELSVGDGSILKVIGSGNFTQTWFKHDLVVELRLIIFPVMLGTGKPLFGEGTIPAAFTLTESLVAPNG